MPDFSDLIARVEAASGPSREIDRLVAKIAGWHRVSPSHMRKKHGGWIAPGDWIGTHSDGSPILDSLHGTEIHRDVPEFTASIDAALTLLPEGYAYSVRENISHDGEEIYCNAQVWPYSLPREEPHCWSNSRRGCPALALCAAILKARQAKEARE